jgi:hypothetical protein
MKSTAKKQSIYYHVTQFGDAANIMKTGKLRGGRIASDERKAHLRAGVSSRGYYVSLARSLSSDYVSFNMTRGGGCFCVLMIDTDKIHGRFKLAPVNYANFKRENSEYEERLISDTEYIDVSDAIVGIVLLAEREYKEYVVRIPRRFFPFTRGRDLFYVTRKNVVVKRPLNLKLASSTTTLTEAKRYSPPLKINGAKFAVLTTSLDKVPELPAFDLSRYVAWCAEMISSDDAAAYQNAAVYNFVTGIAVRQRTQPVVVLRNMLEVSQNALIKRKNEIIESYILDFALAAKRARRLQYSYESFSKKSGEVRIIARIFAQLGVAQSAFAELYDVYHRTELVVMCNPPREMAKMPAASGRIVIDRKQHNSEYTFNDDQEFDLESLKDYVFNEASTKLRTALEPHLDVLYRK